MAARMHVGERAELLGWAHRTVEGKPPPQPAGAPLLYCPPRCADESVGERSPIPRAPTSDAHISPSQGKSRQHDHRHKDSRTSRYVSQKHGCKGHVLAPFSSCYPFDFPFTSGLRCSRESGIMTPRPSNILVNNLSTALAFGASCSVLVSLRPSAKNARPALR